MFNDVFFVFSFKLFVILNKLCVFRFQISSTSDFVITNYKVQNATYSNIVLNLRRDNRIRFDVDNHKRFCFTYVQFFRFQIFESFQLLQAIFNSRTSITNYIRIMQTKLNSLIFYLKLLWRLEWIISKKNDNVNIHFSLIVAIIFELEKMITI